MRRDKKWKKWRYIIKLDPDKKLNDKKLSRIIELKVDAIMVSGTQNVTKDKVIDLLSRIDDYDIPKVLEPSHPACICDGFDYIFIPTVLNTQKIEWLIGKHVEWIKKSEIDWEKIIPEGYIVLNKDSAVGNVTAAITNLNEKDVVAYAICGEKFFNLPIIYIEYSGQYGNEKIVNAVKHTLKNSYLYYGGGINTKEKALRMLRYADTIVIGNAIYEDFDRTISIFL